MAFNIPPVGGADRAGPAPRSAPADKADFGASLEAAVNVSTLPASPPPSVLEEMHAAARVARGDFARKRASYSSTATRSDVVVAYRSGTSTAT